jgi:L-ribulose-5-phosphate 4-epimerase
VIDEGYTKYECEWRETPPFPAAAIEELNAWRNRLHELGLIGHYPEHGVGFGNVSIREGDSGRFIISGTQTGHITHTGEEHYARVTSCDIGANRVVCEGPVQASSEALTHAAIYALNPGIRAVVHVHNADLWQALIDRIPTTSRDVAYGTPEMAREFQRLYADTDFRVEGIAVMGGHDEGLVTFGKDISQAAERILSHAATRRRARCPTRYS